MAKRLACVDIAQMDFDRGQLNAGDRIAQRVRRVGEGTWVDQHPICPCACGVECIDQDPFVVALERAHLMVGGGCNDTAIDVGQRQRAIDLGLACPQQIQIGAMQQGDFCHFRIFQRALSALRGVSG